MIDPTDKKWPTGKKRITLTVPGGTTGGPISTRVTIKCRGGVEIFKVGGGEHGQTGGTIV